MAQPPADSENVHAGLQEPASASAPQVVPCTVSNSSVFYHSVEAACHSGIGPPILFAEDVRR